MLYVSGDTCITVTAACAMNLVGFDYDAMDDDVWGGSEGEEEEEGEGEMSEAQLEKLLLQNISDEEEGGMNEDEEEREEEDELEDREPPKSRFVCPAAGLMLGGIKCD